MHIYVRVLKELKERNTKITHSHYHQRAKHRTHEAHTKKENLYKIKLPGGIQKKQKKNYWKKNVCECEFKIYKKSNKLT